MSAGPKTAPGESGFTLIELMVATVIGMIVILAALTLLDTSQVLSAKVTDRTDSSQRGRLAMEQMTRQLRSQICLTAGSAAILNGGSYSVTFLYYLAAANASGMPTATPNNWVPHKATIAWTAGPPGKPGTITETDYPGTGSPPNTTFSTGTTRTLLTDVYPPSPPRYALNTPIFTYYPFAASGQLGAAYDTSTSNLSAAQQLNTVGIGIHFVVNPARQATSNEFTDLQNKVYVRSADPNEATPVVQQCQ